MTDDVGLRLVAKQQIMSMTMKAALESMSRIEAIAESVLEDASPNKDCIADLKDIIYNVNRAKAFLIEGER